MPWKRRNGKFYWYTSQLVGKKSVSKYVGRGSPGQVAADLIMAAIQRRLEARLAWQAEQRDYVGLLPLIRSYNQWAELLVAAELLLAGSYRPDRKPWRLHHGRAVER